MAKRVKVAIIGGGASGLVAGIEALKHHHDVCIYEKNSKIGRKILATGNGRCNVTNEHVGAKFYHTKNKEFVSYVLDQFSFLRCKEYFADLGVEFCKKENGRCYPMSLQALSIVEALTFAYKNLGGKIQLDTFITDIHKKSHQFIIEKEHFDRLIIATGSKAMEKLGSSDSGYKFAKFFAHKVTKTFPSLVQVITKESLSEFAGVKFEAKVTLKINQRQKEIIGDTLFTKYGLSGSAILDISRDIAPALEQKDEVKVALDCLHTHSYDVACKIVLKQILAYQSKPIVDVLNGLVHKKLAKYVLKRMKIPYGATRVGANEVKSLIKNLKNLTFTVLDTKGFEFCEVASGGVDVSEIDKRSMCSKKQKGLYFCGEVLDVDGDCGGFNLHFAWASGYAAGNHLN